MPKIYEMIGKKEKTFKPDGSRWPELLGIELELENVRNVRELPYWQVKADNSLRNGVEYVLDSPFGGATLEEAIKTYYGANLEYDNSVRTSTHIHLNVLDTEFDVVRAMIAIVYMIEDSLYNVVEAERKWAGYSMPMSEMNAARLRTVLSAPWPDYGNRILANLAPTKNQERYYGFNFAAIRKYGTVEFRYYPGGPSQQDLESWIDFAIAIKNAAKAVGSPAGLIDRLNNEGDVVAFLDEFFPGVWANALLANSTAAAMFEKFNEVAALCTDFTMDRRDPVVFITSSLMKFVGAKILKKEGLAYLEKLRPLGAMSADEWDYHFDKAVRAEKGQGISDDEYSDAKIKPYTGRRAGIFREVVEDENEPRAAIDFEVNNPFDEVAPAAPAPTPARDAGYAAMNARLATRPVTTRPTYNYADFTAQAPPVLNGTQRRRLELDIEVLRAAVANAHTAGLAETAARRQMQLDQKLLQLNQLIAGR